MHAYLTGHRVFGPYLRNYQEGKGIPLRAKVVALLMMWSSLAYALWRFETLWLQLGLLAIGAGVTVYLLRLPSSSNGSS
jgi:hypothetical protein